jgi:hypothetical protein
VARALEEIATGWCVGGWRRIVVWMNAGGGRIATVKVALAMTSKMRVGGDEAALRLRLGRTPSLRSGT